MENGDTIGLFCSGVSGAFVRVSEPRLTLRLEQKGIRGKLLRIFVQWLRPRIGYVVVHGKSSGPSDLQEAVFQGTVLGPLCGIYFSKMLDVLSTERLPGDDFCRRFKQFQKFSTECC